jgi:NADPH-dependent 2,4-dienoyl-CoA reductase/sulfur reductase-like enzyme
VILYEKEGYLGGQVKLASIPPSKTIYQEVANSRLRSLKELCVDIHCGQDLTADMVREIRPDVLIVATGSESAIPNIPGINGKRVMSARRALTSEEVGPSVLVMGGGLVGCETADYLAGKGLAVTIVEMLKHTARDIGPAARFFLRQRLKEKHVLILTQSTVKSIDDDFAIVNTPGGEQRLGPFDTIVMATGATPVTALEGQVKGIVPEVHVIGDACKPGKIMTAVEQGADIALKL